MSDDLSQYYRRLSKNEHLCTYGDCSAILRGVSLTNIARHVKRHLGLHIDTWCRYCDYSHESSADVNRHENRIHTPGEKKPFCCDDCGIAWYPFKGTLNRYHKKTELCPAPDKEKENREREKDLAGRNWDETKWEFKYDPNIDPVELGEELVPAPVRHHTIVGGSSHAEEPQAPRPSEGFARHTDQEALVERRKNQIQVLVKPEWSQFMTAYQQHHVIQAGKDLLAIHKKVETFKEGKLYPFLEKIDYKNRRFIEYMPFSRRYFHVEANGSFQERKLPQASISHRTAAIHGIDKEAWERRMNRRF